MFSVALFLILLGELIFLHGLPIKIGQMALEEVSLVTSNLSENSYLIFINLRGNSRDIQIDFVLSGVKEMSPYGKYFLYLLKVGGKKSIE